MIGPKKTIDDVPIDGCPPIFGFPAAAAFAPAERRRRRTSRPAMKGGMAVMTSTATAMGEKPSSRASGVAGKHAVHGDRNKLEPWIQRENG